MSRSDPQALIAPVVARSRLIAVVTVDEAAWGPPLARALAAGGVPAIEITLRTPAGLEAVRAAAAEVPEALVGAGTCLTVADLEGAKAAGAAFAVSPGLDPDPKPCRATAICAVRRCGARWAAITCVRSVSRASRIFRRAICTRTRRCRRWRAGGAEHRRDRRAARIGLPQKAKTARGIALGA